MRTTLLTTLLVLGACAPNLDAVPHPVLGVVGEVDPTGATTGSLLHVFLGSTDPSCPPFATPVVTVNGVAARLFDPGGLATSLDLVTSCQPAHFAVSGEVDATAGVTVEVTQGPLRWTLGAPTFCAARTLSLDLPADLVVQPGARLSLRSSKAGDHLELAQVTGVDAKGQALFTRSQTELRADLADQPSFLLPSPLPATLAALRLERVVFEASAACEGPERCVVRCVAAPLPDLRVVLPDPD
jgi:hypothetical protein